MSKKKERKKDDATVSSEAEDEQQHDNGVVSDFEQSTQSDDGWVEHRDGDVVKLKVGETISGLLVDKSISHKYNDCGIYKIKLDDDPIPKVILGCKQLDRAMSTIDVNTVVKIVFEGKKPSEKGNPMNVFRVFTKE